MAKIRYHIPVNISLAELRQKRTDDDTESATIQVVTIDGSKQKRKKLMIKFLMHTYEYNRETALKAIKGLGFIDLL